MRIQGLRKLVTPGTATRHPGTTKATITALAAALLTGCLASEPPPGGGGLAAAFPGLESDRAAHDAQEFLDSLVPDFIIASDEA